MRTPFVFLVASTVVPVVLNAQAAEGRAFGAGLGYATYGTSYYTDTGAATYYPYIVWSQVQLAGFVERGGGFNIGTRPTRLRLEARLGYGGAEDDGTTATSAGTSLTDGGASAGLGATLRVPLTQAASATQVYVGAGVDFTVLTAFGNDGSSYFSDGWAEYLVMVPLVAGVRLQSGRLVIRPELRYAPFGIASTTLDPPSSAGLDQNDAPSGFTLMVSLSRR